MSAYMRERVISRDGEVDSVTIRSEPTLDHPRQPEIARIITGEEIKRKTGLSAPHTVHCMPGEIITVSMLGDRNGVNDGSRVSGR